jgi:large subunit ribosomal protein L1
MKKGKLYRARKELINQQQDYSLEEALAFTKKFPVCKFDETVELSFRLGIDPRQADQMVRGAMVLPNGTGKTVRAVVIAVGEAADAARNAGADEVGFDELLERIKNGWLDFDVLIATPGVMQKLRPLGRVLGPRGLMPNPKTGTVTEDTAKAVQDAKAGRVEYRADRGGCVHVPVGKVSFEVKALEENAMAVVNTILRARPATSKGTYLQGLSVSLTMSPGIKIDTRNLVKA